jgi:hypothetical protein
MARRIAGACELVHASTRRSAWSISAGKELIETEKDVAMSPISFGPLGD